MTCMNIAAKSYCYCCFEYEGLVCASSALIHIVHNESPDMQANLMYNMTSQMHHKFSNLVLDGWMTWDFMSFSTVFHIRTIRGL